MAAKRKRLGILAIVIVGIALIAGYFLLLGPSPTRVVAQQIASKACTAMQDTDYDKVITSMNSSWNLRWEARHSGEDYHSLFTARTKNGILSHQSERITKDGIAYYRETPVGKPQDFGEWVVLSANAAGGSSLLCFATELFTSGNSNTSTERHLTMTSSLESASGTMTTEIWVKSTGYPTRGRQTYTIYQDIESSNTSTSSSPTVKIADETYSGFGEKNTITAPIATPTPQPTPTPTGMIYSASFRPVDIGQSVGFDATNGTLNPAYFTVNGNIVTITKIVWENGKLIMELQPSAALNGHYADFIVHDDVIALRLDFDDATETTSGTKRTFEWGVCTQPWVSGDLLMLRMSKSGETLTGVTNDTLPCSKITLTE